LEELDQFADLSSEELESISTDPEDFVFLGLRKMIDDVDVTAVREKRRDWKDGIL